MLMPQLGSWELDLSNRDRNIWFLSSVHSKNGKYWLWEQQFGECYYFISHSNGPFV